MRQTLIFVLAAGLLLTACGGFTCDDPLGCVAVQSGEPIALGAALTLSGPDSVYGIDALRGIELAITDRGEVLGHEISLSPEDDGCSAEGGEAAARKLADNPTIVAVIGTTCSSGTTRAAKVLTEAGMEIGRAHV